MILKSCYIRAFGSLKDIELSFDSGLNQFLCDNGIGKTTFITFIKAMLYGLEYKQGSRIKFYEREHFLPWDGDDCGGSLTLVHEDKTYRIERSFGKKLNDDTFSLINVETLMRSEDFGEDIGEAILGVDRDSFEKSLFFGQSALNTALTPSLNAKMGNVADVRDDMNRFDEAIKSIDKARVIYDRKSGTNPGKINSISKEIKICEEAAEKIPVLEGSLRKRKESIDQKKKDIDAMLKIKDELAEKIKSVAAKKEKIGSIKEKKEQLKKLNEEITELDDFFGGKIPKEEDINQMQSLQSTLVEKQSRLAEINDRIPEESRVEFLSSVFAGENPITGEIIENSQKNVSEMNGLRALGQKDTLPKEKEEEYESAKEFFKYKHPTTEEISSLLQENEAINKIKAEYDLLSQRKKEEERELGDASLGTPPVFIVLIFAGLLFIVAGLLGGILISGERIGIVVSIAGVLLGAIIILASLIFVIQTRTNQRRIEDNIKRKILEIDNQMQVYRLSIEEFDDRFHDFIEDYPEIDGKESYTNILLDIQTRLIEFEGLNKLIESGKITSAQDADLLAELTMELYAKLDDVAGKYGYDLHNEHNEEELLRKLAEDIKEYDMFLSNTSQAKELNEEADGLKDTIDTFMEKYEWEDGKNTEQKLLALKGLLDSYNSVKKKIIEIETDLEGEQEEDEDYDENILEELQKQSKKIDDDYEPMVSDRVREEEELSRILGEIEECEEIGRQLPALKEKLEEYRERVDILVDTKKYLEQAREDFLSVYMKPLREGMDKYLSKFLSDVDLDGLDISLDMDLSVSLNKRGKTYSGEHLSEGYKDLAAMCARFALIDVLYKNTKHPLLLDDPFTNLDESKIQKALAILDEISRDSQILYLSCHGSRVAPGYKTFSP